MQNASDSLFKWTETNDEAPSDDSEAFLLFVYIPLFKFEPLRMAKKDGD